MDWVMQALLSLQHSDEYVESALAHWLSSALTQQCLLQAHVYGSNSGSQHQCILVRVVCEGGGLHGAHTARK